MTTPHEDHTEHRTDHRADHSDEAQGPDDAHLNEGVGTDGSLHSTHDRDHEPHPGVGTDGSLHSTTPRDDDNRSD